MGVGHWGWGIGGGSLGAVHRGRFIWGGSAVHERGHRFGVIDSGCVIHRGSLWTSYTSHLESYVGDKALEPRRHREPLIQLLGRPSQQELYVVNKNRSVGRWIHILSFFLFVFSHSHPPFFPTCHTFPSFLYIRFLYISISSVVDCACASIRSCVWAFGCGHSSDVKHGHARRVRHSL